MSAAKELDHLIRHRRSVFPKQFVPGKQVPHHIISQIVGNACWAPNHGGEEPWHFNIYSGEGLKKLATFQAELYKTHAGADFKEEKYAKLQSTPLLASHIISLGMKRTLTKRIPEIEDIEAVACAVQNIYLSVTANELGGYWTTGGVTYLPEAKSFFGLGEHDRLLGFFYIGYVQTPSPAGKRKPMEEKVTWIND